MDRIKEALEARDSLNAYRQLSPENELIDFSSNNYLGLDEKVKAKNEEGRGQITGNKVFINKSGSRLLTGNSSFKETVEQQVADFHSAQSALIFGAGYLANLGLISTVAQRPDTVIYDSLIHASLRDGVQLSKARNFSFEHNSLEDLEAKLKRSESEETFVITESIFSMDGDGPNLRKTADLCSAHNAKLIVDEAHAIGVLGNRGQGLVSSLGLEEDVFATVVTFGKALGFHGGAVLCSRELREYLINFCRPFIYTTAPDNTFFEAIKGRYEALANSEDIRGQLSNNIELFRELCQAHKLPVVGGVGAVFSLRVPGNAEVKRVSDTLKQAGVDVRPILSPTVPEGSERLRICMHAYNTAAEIELLTKTLVSCLVENVSL